MNKIFFSVATYDYLPQLLCAYESFSRNNDIHKSFIFVVDAKKEQLPSLNSRFQSIYKNFFLFCFEDIDGFETSFKNASLYYDNFEMSCLAKVVGARYVINKIKNNDFMIYCDADLYFTGPIDSLINEMAEMDILITPHNISPKINSSEEHEYLIHGWVNGGFMIVRKGNEIVNQIFEWLIDRIYHRGFNAPSLFMFVDQAWISAIPFLFRDYVYISNNLGANVAYWNLNERKIQSIKDNSFKVFDQDLIFFHFSGYIKNNTQILSKHYKINSIETEYPSVYSLINTYNRLLLEADKIVTDLKLDSISKFKFSKASLTRRILIAEKINKVTLYGAGYKEKMFTKIVRRVKKIFKT